MPKITLKIPKSKEGEPITFLRNARVVVGDGHLTVFPDSPLAAKKLVLSEGLEVRGANSDACGQLFLVSFECGYSDHVISSLKFRGDKPVRLKVVEYGHATHGYRFRRTGECPDSGGLDIKKKRREVIDNSP